MKNLLTNWLTEWKKKMAAEHGANLVEYALLISLIGAGVAMGMLAASQSVNQVFQKAVVTLSASGGNTGSSGSAGSGGSVSGSGNSGGSNGNGNGNNGSGNGNGGSGNGNNGNGHANGHSK